MSPRFNRGSPRVVIAAVCALLCAPAAALAHGDASSHYLETGSLYASFGDQPTEKTELQLIGLLDAAKKANFPLKVGLVANESDLVDTPELLNKPQEYAEYVVEQLEGVRVALHAPVLIVAPAGIGLAGPQSSGDIAGIKRATGSTGEDLAVAALAAVRHLAAASGHPLPAYVPPAKVPVVPQSSGTGSGYDLGALVPIAVFAGIFGSAVALYEGRTRLARRKHGRMSATSGAA